MMMMMTMEIKVSGRDSLVRGMIIEELVLQILRTTGQIEDDELILDVHIHFPFILSIVALLWLFSIAHPMPAPLPSSFYRPSLSSFPLD